MFRSHPRWLLAARQQGDLRLPLRGSVGSWLVGGSVRLHVGAGSQITNELKSAFDWLNAKASEHGIQGPIIVTGWSAGGHLTSFILDHPKVAAGLAISGVFDLGALRDSPHVNDKVKLSEQEIQNLSPMRRPIVNKPLGIAYGTGELPAMIASSREYHAYRSQGHVPGDLIPIANTNHFTILDELRQPNSTLTRAVIAMAEYQTA